MVGWGLWGFSLEEIVLKIDYMYENIYLSLYNVPKVGVWVGRWCWVASSVGRPTTLAYGRAEARCACSRCGTSGLLFIYFFISSNLSSFSNASSLRRWLDILKYCGLGRYNPTVVVSYYRKWAR